MRNNSMVAYDGEEHTKGSWTPEEDDALRKQVDRMGARSWSEIAKAIPGRTGKSCRLRWLNQLNPEVRKDPFTAEEDAAIMAAHNILATDGQASQSCCRAGRTTV
ncbi:c-myb-like transcription factor [Scenedesmus sp. NREL 46B-D3]|nr:c-myb-like transcription factor [Scenedesmus sp. NREL 46B-D3]